MTGSPTLHNNNRQNKSVLPGKFNDEDEAHHGDEPQNQPLVQWGPQLQAHGFAPDEDRRRVDSLAELGQHHTCGKGSGNEASEQEA